MADRVEFTRRFAAALTRACAERQVTQKQLGERIAEREHRHRRPGLQREEAIARSRERWPRRLSAWKKGIGHPATFDQLSLALDVIAPDTPRPEWEQWWRQARDGTSAVDAHASSGYLAQVAQFAPPALFGRENELDELAEFCLADDVVAVPCQYQYWKAEAWAGKSALLSTFVLHPPELLRSKVQIVSFFVTTRQASRDTRDAFTRVLTQQLAELTDQPLPHDEVNREARLLELIDQATRTCQATDRRLVLVIDGLDEDRGASNALEGRSIAGLLPARLPTGMRVILAGRPNPPIPGDVEPWHPLRDDSIVRSLPASPYAKELRHRAERELRRLLGSNLLEQDLVGLLAAACGGLSVDDLHALTEPHTDSSIWEIEDIVHFATGRTFLCQASPWQDDNHPDTYILGHDKLREAATRSLGDRRMGGYRDRLHDWADTYHADGWPAHTPEYLLSDYYGLLTELEDLPRLITYSTSAARHDRMLERTGGDAAALAETLASLDLVARQRTPDLCNALRLAYHRDEIAARNTQVPAALPAVWATLGHIPRAEALARSIPDTGQRASALAAVALVLVSAGFPDRALRLALEGGQIARSIPMVCSIREGRWILDLEYEGVATLAVVGRALVAVGQRETATRLLEQAETDARAIPDMAGRVCALTDIARAWAAAGHADQAVELAQQAATVVDSLSDVEARVCALTDIARAWAAAGHADQAAEVVQQAATMVRSISDRELRTMVAPEIAQAWASAGRPDKAIGLARQMNILANLSDDSDSQMWAYVATAAAWVAAGDPGQAETIALSIPDSELRAWVLTSVARAWAADRDPGRAETIALSIPDPALRAVALTAAAEAWVAAGISGKAVGLVRQAETVARTVSVVRSAHADHLRPFALAAVARAVASAGHHDQAAALAEQAETAARSTTQVGHSSPLVQVVRAWVAAGRVARAENVARSIPEPFARATAFAVVGRAWAAAGLVTRAETMARLLPRYDADGFVEVARAWAVAGHIARAELVALRIDHFDGRAEALAAAAQAVAAVGHRDQAVRLALLAEALERSSGYLSRARVSAAVARAWVSAGHPRRAETISHTITDPRYQASALAKVAQAWAADGSPDHAAGLVRQAETVARTITNPRQQASALAAVAQAWVAARNPGHAERVARFISDLAQQGGLMVEIARALAASGYIGYAERVAYGIPDLARQADALTEIAQALLATGEVRNARRIAMAASRSGRWISVLGVFLRLDRAVAAVVADLSVESSSSAWSYALSPRDLSG